LKNEFLGKHVRLLCVSYRYFFIFLKNYLIKYKLFNLLIYEKNFRISLSTNKDNLDLNDIIFF